jgi:hypothetical protein
MSRFLLTAIILGLVSLGTYAAEQAEGAKLYATQLQSITMPRYFQEKASKKHLAILSSTYVYLVIKSDGVPVWTSPKKKVRRNQTVFEWPATHDAMPALLWEKGNTISINVFFSDKKVEISEEVEASATAGRIGVVGLIGVGALIGGIAAGVFTGGLGAPAGALIGAVIGGCTGIAAGTATGALSANDRIVFEMKCPRSEEFPLNGRLDYDETNLGEKHTASVAFRLREAKTPVDQGNLALGERYIVRILSIHLSQAAALKGGKKVDSAKYYVVLKQGANEYPFRKEAPFALTTDINVKIPIVTVLKNTGEGTEVLIYKKNRVRRDALVFSSKTNKNDGKSWAFIGKASANDVADKSFVAFETFGPLK